jgi:dephospho-CoA kinase
MIFVMVFVMVFILGVTGGIASGKTTATTTFQSQGITVVDADVIARQAVSKNSVALEEIIEHFGNTILLDSGELNRPLLRDIIFSAAPEKQRLEKKWLENLLHPLVRKSILQQLANIDSIYGVLSSPLLFEQQQQLLVNRTLVIDCPDNQQKARASKRDGVSEQQIEDVMCTQLSRAERNQQADDIIINDSSVAALEYSVKQYHKKLLKEITPCQQS